MTSARTDPITGFHAHIYYDPVTRDVAAWLRDELSSQFAVTLGRWHDRPVGPHPKSMYQVAFAPDQFGALVPWLMLNRSMLDILIHAETGDDVADHTHHALWLGNKLTLNLDALRHD